jgi:hypothetical protein
VELAEQQSDAMTNFMYGLRAPESRRQYPARLKVYLDFLGLKSTIPQQASEFLDKAKTDAVWAQGLFVLAS